MNTIIFLTLVYFIIAIIIFIINLIIYFKCWRAYLTDTNIPIETRQYYYDNNFFSFTKINNPEHFWWVSTLDEVFKIAILWPFIIPLLLVCLLIISLIYVSDIFFTMQHKFRKFLISRFESWLFPEKQDKDIK